MNKDIEILGYLAGSGISVRMLSATRYELSGFYKSGTVVVDISNKTITARYAEVTKYDDLKDSLVAVNYHWWCISKGRSDGWENPDKQWEPLLLEYGYIKMVVKTSVEYV